MVNNLAALTECLARNEDGTDPVVTLKPGWLKRRLEDSRVSIEIHDLVQKLSTAQKVHLKALILHTYGN